MIAPAVEVLTSPLVFVLLRRRFGERAGYLLGFVWYWLARACFSRCGLSGHVLWPRH